MLTRRTPFCTRANKHHLNMPRRASRGPREEEGEEEDCEDLQDSSGLQASLHSRKEQKRRLHIRTSCQNLCDLLPFVEGPLDTATTLELTARYIGYIKTSLPPDLLTTVNKTVEQNMKGSWKKTENSSKKRKTICLKRNTTQRSKPSAQKTPDNAALWRNIQPMLSVSADQPHDQTTTLLAERPSPPPPPPTTGPVVMPILLDKSSVPRGQMLPLCQEQSFSASSSFQYVENNWIVPPPRAFSSPAFPNPTFSSTSCPSPAFNAMTSSTHISQTAVLPEATDTAVGGESVANHVVTLQIMDAAAHNMTDPSSGELAMTTAVNLDAVWDCQDQTIVLSFSLPPAISDDTTTQVQHLPHEPSVVLERENTTVAVVESATASERWEPSFDAPIQQSGVCGSPITTDAKDKVSPYWLDLLFDDNLCIPEAIFENNLTVENHANDQTHGTL